MIQTGRRSTGERRVCDARRDRGVGPGVGGRPAGHGRAGGRDPRRVPALRAHGRRLEGDRGPRGQQGQGMAGIARLGLEVRQGPTDRQEPGAPQLKNVISVGLTKEGESFAAGGGAADLPKCIMTGGAASMTVSYQGKTYPVCCSGCRDEFNDNPEKYAKKADLAAKADPGKGKAAEKPPAKGKDDASI